MDDAISKIHACRRADGVDRIYAPGEMEAERRAAYQASGIPLNDVTLRNLVQTARKMDVSTGGIVP